MSEVSEEKNVDACIVDEIDSGETGKTMSLVDGFY